MDSSLGEGLVVGGDVFLFLFGTFEAGLSGDGVQDSFCSYGGVFAGLGSQGDFCVAQFGMFMDFWRELPWERIPYGMVGGKEAFLG